MGVSYFLRTPLLPDILNLIFATAIYLFGMMGYSRMKKSTDFPTETTTASDVEKAARKSKVVGRRQARTIVASGLTTFYLLFLVNALAKFPSGSLASFFVDLHWNLIYLLWIAVIGLTFMYVKGVYNNKGNAKEELEKSRAGYLDALKVIITAAAAATSIIPAAASNKLLAAGQTNTRDAAITFLVVAILLATCDLFWLNLLYDRARVSGAAVSNRGIIFPLFVVLWPAGVLFVMGFAYLARLTVSFQ